MQNTESLPWYKQFWPWFLIIVPATSMVLSFTMMHLAFTNEDSMVIDDYYKEGKGINVKLQAIENAKALNIVIQAKITNQNIELTFISGEPENGEALTLDFYHSTQEHKDFSTKVFRDANGIYRAPIDKVIDGKWRLSIHPFTNSWKIQKTISLPQESAFEIKP
ncbi:FixH family protein [Paraglaciecola aquimarina]|uniref:FixH family protein n=1 Tax=Paraglaciecola algarum TaxID=3050085 RepID=A0ABS9D4V9_9ALTE|nr:FixH family protein [Paraglaciecola sp. G1-23]MCF2947063.1 FixH family protein [Paraglaciecola sp. G1-23]